jgi:hypothetical protein
MRLGIAPRRAVLSRRIKPEPGFSFQQTRRH